MSSAGLPVELFTYNVSLFLDLTSLVVASRRVCKQWQARSSVAVVRWIARHIERPAKNVKAMVCLSHQSRDRVLQNWLLRDVKPEVYLNDLLSVESSIRIHPPFLEPWYSDCNGTRTTEWILLACRQRLSTTLTAVMRERVVWWAKARVYLYAFDRLITNNDDGSVAFLQRFLDDDTEGVRTEVQQYRDYSNRRCKLE
jgi:hypothetical protein